MLTYLKSKDGKQSGLVAIIYLSPKTDIICTS